MAKHTPSKLDNMPSNVIRPISMPVTAARFMVINKDTGAILKKDNRSWYVYDNARQRDNRGENVEVVGWNDLTGRHDPVGEFMTKINAHGDMEGNWRAVSKQRFEDAKAKRTKTPAAEKPVSAVQDDTTATMFRDLSLILSNAATNMRKGLLTDKDLADLYKEVNDLGDHLYGMLPEQQSQEETPAVM